MSIRFWYVLAWAIAALLPLTDGDIWWHLSAGRWIWENGQLPWQDPLTYTAMNHDWLDVHWLYQLLLYGVQHWTGSVGLVLLHAGLWAGAAWVWSKEKMSPWILILLLLLFINRNLLLARPLALTLLILGMQWRLYQANTTPAKWAGILLLQVLLANTQGLFILGPILWVLWSISQSTALIKTLLGTVAMWMVNILNPRGYELWLYPWELWKRLLPGNVFGEHVAENVSLLRAWRGTSSWAENSLMLEFWIWVALVVLLVVISWRGSWRKSLWLWPVVGLALLAERNLPILLLLGLPWLASHFPVQWSWNWVRSWGIALVLGFTLAVGQWWWKFPQSVAPYRFPEQAVQWMQARYGQSSLRIFNEIRQGGYLEWYGKGYWKPYVDGRLILRDSTFFAQLLKLEKHPQEFALIEKHAPMDLVILPLSNPPFYRSLAQWLDQQPQWKAIYSDSQTRIWKKK